MEDYKKKSEQYLAGWQRARADFLNYKKEEIKRVEQILQYANLNLILKILPILDNFDLAEKKLPENLKNDENIKGLLQIKAQFKNLLKSNGVEEIKTIGTEFDPNFMEAVEATESPPLKASTDKSGIVLDEIQKGYTINGKILRPAKVKVAKQPEI